MYDDWCCGLNGRGCFCNVEPTEGSMGCLECSKNSGKELFCSNECYEKFCSTVVPAPTEPVGADEVPF